MKLLNFNRSSYFTDNMDLHVDYDCLRLVYLYFMLLDYCFQDLEYVLNYILIDL